MICRLIATYRRNDVRIKVISRITLYRDNFSKKLFEKYTHALALTIPSTLLSKSMFQRKRKKILLILLTMFSLATVKKQISEVRKYFQNTFENMAKINILSKKLGGF
jgi:hypothetical protein